jgi:RNA polymerase sigma-70 factor (ECF subfamily)
MPFSSINPTSASLLEQLKTCDNSTAWQRFVRVYTPLLYSWARRGGLSPEDAADRVQDVFVILSAKLPEFRYDARCRFRGWLWTVFLNCCRQHWRRADVLAGAQPFAREPAGPDENAEWDEEEYRRHLVGEAMRIMRADFPETTWRACWEYVANGRAPADVARELGISVDTVYQSKVRVLRHLHEELAGLLD